MPQIFDVVVLRYNIKKLQFKNKRCAKAIV
jgi:hypothetical protein